MDEAIDIQELTSPDIQIEPEREIEKGMYDLAAQWLTQKEGGLTTRLEANLPITRDNVISMADLQGDIAKVFLRMSYWNDSDPRVAQQLQLDRGDYGNLWQILYGKHGDSIVNRLGANSHEAYDTFIGPASVVTFCELLQGANPEAFDRLNPLSIVASARDDVENKIDVILDFGLSNKEGKKVLRLVQLKTDKNGQIGVVRIRPDNLKTNYFGSVTKKDAKNMLGAAKYFSSMFDADVHSFVVMVPSFDSDVCNNPLGKIKSSEAKMVKEIFTEDAVRENLVPKPKK